jgi:hypothetical protein
MVPLGGIDFPIDHRWLDRFGDDGFRDWKNDFIGGYR